MAVFGLIEINTFVYNQNSFIKRITLLVVPVSCLVYLILHLKYVYLNEYVLFVKQFQQSSNFSKPTLIGEESRDKWQGLGNPKERHQVYSAFYDNRPETIGYHQLKQNVLLFGTVRVFGILRTNFNSRVSCTFLNSSRHQIMRMDALKAEPITEHLNLPFSAFMISCPLGVIQSRCFVELPKYVAVSYDSDPMTTSNPVLIPVRYGDQILKGMDPYRKLAICTGPVHNNYSEARRVVEFVRISRLMGVEKVYFYYLSSTPAVKKVLDYFEQEGSAQVLDWNLKGFIFEKDVRYAGIFAAINECVYRATFVDNFKYVAILDLDEYLVPFTFTNLLEYIQSIDDDRLDSFVFRTVFFHKQDEPKSFGSPLGARNKFLYTQARTVRTRIPNPIHNRTKFIVKGRSAIEVANHFVWRSIRSVSEKSVDIKDGLVFHYRDDCIKTETCQTPRQNDTTMHRYGKTIWKLIDETCHEIFEDGICPVGGKKT